MRSILFLVAILASYCACAQYTRITHTSGTVAYGSRSFTVTASGGTGTYPDPCLGSPSPQYYAGSGVPGTYNYVSSAPVYAIKLESHGLNSGTYGNGEYLEVAINGVPYTLTPADIVSYSHCGSSGAGPCYLYNGRLYGPLGPFSYYHHNAGRILIRSCVGINSFSITCNGIGNGVAYHLSVDTTNPGDCLVASNNGPLCDGDSLQLFATGITGSAYNWFGPSGFTSTLQNPVRPSATSAYGGVYFVVQTIGGVSDTAYTTVVVNPMPSVTVVGSTSVCTGSATTLVASTAGGSWSSADTSIATVNNSGVVTGVTAGSTTISCIVSNSCGSDTATSFITVSPAPSVGSICGNGVLCTGSIAVMSNCVDSGTWSSSNTAVASITAGGRVTAVGAGTAIISYTLSASCGSAAATKIITVNSPAATLSGPPGTTIGGTIGLSVGGGVWSSGNTAIATVDSLGQVTGVSPGTAIISFSMTGGCHSFVATKIVTIDSLAGDPITGTLTLCQGSSTALGCATPGGTWSSSNTSVATVSASGTVSGLAAGTSVISYSLSSGVITAVITVNALPSEIAGPATICVGSSTTYTNAVSGGTWSASSSTISLTASGTVTALAAGSATITYTLATGCSRTYDITINSIPAITGLTSLCIGGTTTLASTTTGGSWSVSNVAIATISSTGIVTAVAPGTAVISYSTSTGCLSVTTVTVLSGLPAITGNAPVCAGSTLSLSNTVIGGSWTTSNAAVATVAATGVVTGVAGGTARITYATAGGCSSSVIVTVTPILPITGNTATCIGNTTTLACGTAGGTWSSNNIAVATVGTTGIVTGVATGTAVITYTVASGCSRTVTVTISSSLPPVTGTLQACVGATTTLSNATPGGTWSTSHATIATINTTGIVSGIAAGTSRISYILGTCRSVAVVTINASPASLTGQNVVCIGTSVTVNSATAGGTWSTASSNITLAGTAGTTATITGVATGTATVSYTAGSVGCYRTYTVTVTPIPAAIAGSYSVCPAGTTQLTNSTTGGTWTSSDASIAFVSTSGRVTGMATGTAIISYRTAGGCITTAVVTVVASPAAISGPSEVCTSSSVSLTNSTGAGTWASSSPSRATVGVSTGVVTGIGSGTTTISFTLTATGCRAFKTMTVVPIPNAGTLSGPSAIAVGGTATITSSGSVGGAWTVSNSNATVGSTGIVTGVSAGSCTITYSVTSACGYSGAYKPITIAAGRPAAPAGDRPGDAPAPFAPRMGGSAIITGATSATAATLQPVVETPAGRLFSSAPRGIDVSVTPNPNRGEFTLQGTLGTTADEDANIEISNMLGQVIYRTRIRAVRGLLHQRLQLPDAFAGGAYTLNITSKAGSRAVHFIVRQ